MTGWFRETPESLRMLAEERVKIARAEARYECQRCGKTLEPDYELSDSMNRLRAWMWRRVHKLNCGHVPKRTNGEALMKACSCVQQCCKDHPAAHPQPPGTPFTGIPYPYTHTNVMQPTPLTEERVRKIIKDEVGKLIMRLLSGVDEPKPGE